MKISKSITIDQNTWTKFREHCQKNGMKMSTRIAILLERDFDEDNS